MSASMLFGKPNWGWRGGANCDLYRGLFNLSAALRCIMQTNLKKNICAVLKSVARGLIPFMVLCAGQGQTQLIYSIQPMLVRWPAQINSQRL